MPKVPLNRPNQATMGQRTESAGNATLGLSLEKRLHDARLKRQEALVARNSVARAASGDQAESQSAPETPTAPSDRKRAVPWRRAKASGAVRNAALAFSVSTGLGFGAALGLGLLVGAGKLPVPNAEAPAGAETRAVVMTEELDGPADMGANGPAKPVAFVADELVKPIERQPVIATVELASPVFEPIAKPGTETGRGPDVLSVISQLPALAPSVTKPVVWPVIAADEPRRTEDAFGDSAPELYQPERSASILETVTFGGEASSGLQYFLHVPSGVPGARLQDLVSRLDRSGVRVAEIGRENFRVSTTHIRFYSPATAEAARAVAAQLGVEARDFSRNFGDTERIEIWVAGRPGSGPATAASHGKMFDSSTAPYDLSNTDR